MNLNKLFQSKKFKIALITIAALGILLLVFGAGEFVGYRRAHFSYKWAENYDRNFGGPRGGFFRDFDDKGYTNANGIFGSIMEINTATSSDQAATLLIKGQDNREKTVLVSNQTVIRRVGETIKQSDLKVDNRVVIIGSPNEQGQIDAKFIRVFP